MYIDKRMRLASFNLFNIKWKQWSQLFLTCVEELSGIDEGNVDKQDYITFWFGLGSEEVYSR